MSAVTIRAERRRLCLRALWFLMVLVMVGAPVRAQAECPDWVPTFGGQPGVDGSVKALQIFDDGTGPALYVGGEFRSAGGVAANNIAKWDGEEWSRLGGGVGSTIGWVSALAVFDDGNGPALYAGGFFADAGGVLTLNIAKWNGQAWSGLGNGVNLGPAVSALAVFDDGNGPALYAGGSFQFAGGVRVNGIARWDGALWSPVGDGFRGSVKSLAVFDDGTGAALYAGAGSPPSGDTNAVSKWDGEIWSPVGNGLNSTVFVLAPIDTGTGYEIYAGGRFSTASGVFENRVVKWNGASWSPVGDVFDGNIFALTSYDDGEGIAVYAGGRFSSAGGVSAFHIAKWDGAMWSPVVGADGSSDLNEAVRAFSLFDDGLGSLLYVGGHFDTSPAGDSFLARWGCTETCEADYNDDGVVDAADIAAFARDLRRDPERTDLDGDRRADGRDLKVFMESWSAGCDGDVGPGRPGSN